MIFNFTIENIYKADRKPRIRVCQAPGMIAGSAIINIETGDTETATRWSLDALDALDLALDDNMLRLHEAWMRHEQPFVLSVALPASTAGQT